MQSIIYPLRFVDDEGTEHQVPDVRELSLLVEFADDADPKYACFDATGARIRLIAWNVEVLSVHRVPANFAPSDITIRHFTTPSGDLYVESIGEATLRALSVDTGSGKTDALSDAPALGGAGVDTSMSAATFHQTWMERRLGKRYP